MKINRLETHDRLNHFKEDQSINIFEGAEDCLKRNPNSLQMQEYFPYIYIFAHPRTADDGFTKRMIWQPRLTKPKPQTNSYLFRANSHSDMIEVIWLLPPREMWGEYEKGKLFENEEVLLSIHYFQNHRAKLEEPHEEDWPEERLQKRLEQIAAAENASIPAILKSA